VGLANFGAPGTIETRQTLNLQQRWVMKLQCVSGQVKNTPSNLAAAEKWNGQLPNGMVSRSSLPFIGVK
jgi:hypothetical protein